MSFAGGTATWQRSRKRARVASSVEHEFEYEEFHEVIDEGADEHKEDGVDDREHAPQDEDADSSSATIISSTLYEAVVDIFTPTNEVKKRTGELLLKARERAGQYNLFAGIDLDAELLEHAGFLTPSATPTERTRFAEKLAEDACASRCGDECCGVCRVRKRSK